MRGVESGVGSRENPPKSSFGRKNELTQKADSEEDLGGGQLEPKLNPKRSELVSLRYANKSLRVAEMPRQARDDVVE